MPHALFIKMQQLFSATPRELKKLSDTRWSCRSSSIIAVKETFPSLLLTLAQLVDDEDNEVILFAKENKKESMIERSYDDFV